MSLFLINERRDHMGSPLSHNSDRHQLVQQIQMIGGGALGQQAATAVRHVAAQNGVWSLGNFGGMPPKSAMMYHQPPDGVESASVAQAPDGSIVQSDVQDGDYRHVFNSCTVGMVSHISVQFYNSEYPCVSHSCQPY